MTRRTRTDAGRAGEGRTLEAAAPSSLHHPVSRGSPPVTRVYLPPPLSPALAYSVHLYGPTLFAANACLAGSTLRGTSHEG